MLMFSLFVFLFIVSVLIDAAIVAILMTETIEIDQLIVQAVTDLNGSIEYDENEVVDEVPTKISTIYIIRKLKKVVLCENDNEIATKKALDVAERLSLIFVNYTRLVALGMTKEKAIKVATIRVGILGSGGLLVDREDECVAKNCFLPEIEYVEAPSTFKVVPGQPPVSTTDENTGVTTVTPGTPAKVTMPKEHADFMALFNALNLEDVKRMTKYLPIMAHMAFAKFGHHYVNTPYWQASYQKQFRSLQLLSLEPAWNQADIIYNAVHWMGPYAMKLWCQNLITNELMPRGLKEKFPVMPAGVALITSTVAVLKAAAAIPGFHAFFEIYAESWKTICDARDKIKQNPYAYHVRADLFGLDSLEPTLAVPKEHAIRLSPCAQAFINKYAQNTELARIQAIKKHAEANLGLMRSYEAIFAGATTKVRQEARVKSIRALITGEGEKAKPGAAPVVVTEVEETT